MRKLRMLICAARTRVAHGMADIGELAFLVRRLAQAARARDRGSETSCGEGDQAGAHAARGLDRREQ